LRYAEKTISVTLTNNSDSDAIIQFHFEADCAVTIAGTNMSTGGDYSSDTIAPGESLVISMTSGTGGNPSTVETTATTCNAVGNTYNLTLSNVELKNDESLTITYGSAVNGSFQIDGDNATAGETKTLSNMDSVTLSATPAEGFIFSGWWFTPEGGTERFVSDNATYSGAKFSENGIITPKFIASNAGYWGVGNSQFDDLNAAIEATTRGTNKVMVLLKDTSISGNYTIPTGVTLHIPFDDDNTIYGDSPEIIQDPNGKYATL
jgi:hypothetical protein